MRKSIFVALSAALFASSVALLAPVTSAGAVEPMPVHGTVVPEQPKRLWPRITTGAVNGGDQVGDYIVYGGEFTSVTLPDGSVVARSNVVAFNINTGELLSTFAPTLDGTVSVVEAGDTPGTVFLGGKFKKVNGVSRARLAKLDLATGQLITGFKANASAEVKTIARSGDRLFIGGQFGAVNGITRSRLAEVSSTTGAVNTNFDVPVTGSRASGCRVDGWCGSLSGPIVRAVRVTPDGGTLMVIHRGDLVGGLTRWGAAKIDISSTVPVVSGWRTNLWDLAQNNGRKDFVGIVEGDMSPDGSMIVFTNIVGNFPPLHDTVVALPVAGSDLVSPLWVTQNFDSNYGLAVSDAAVYVGGHFCWTESPLSSTPGLYWPGALGNQYSCTSISGSVFQPMTIARYHLAALDPSNGTALPWNPGSNNSNNGVNFLRTIPRGLLLGHDGTRVDQINVGRSAFFDLQ